MDEYDGEIEMLDDAYEAAIAGVEYTEEGEPQIVYNGEVLVQLHTAFGFSEGEAYAEIDSWRGGPIRVLWPVNLVVRPDKPNLTLVPGNKKDLH